VANRVALGQLDKAIRVTGTGIPENTFVKLREYNQISSGGSFFVTAVGIGLTKTPTASPSGDITLHFPDGETFVSDSYTSSGTSTTSTLQTYTGGSNNPVIFAPWIYLTDYGENDFQATPLSSSDILGRQPDFGLKVSKPGVDVDSATSKQLLFDSTVNRIGAIYAGGVDITYGALSDYFRFQTGALYQLSNQVGNKIIINGTTVTISSATNFGYTSTNDLVNDINAANITGVTASAVSIALKIQGSSSISSLTIAYPATNSLQSHLNLAPATLNAPVTETTGTNFLTTGNKTSLGYIPLVVFSERNKGELDIDEGDASYWFQERSFFKTTTSHFVPATMTVDTNDGPNDGRNYDQTSSLAEDARNVSFFVLRIPCAYGYMTSTYFG